MVVDQGWRGVRAGGAVIAKEICAGLAAEAGPDRTIGGAGSDFGSRLGRLKDDVDPLVAQVVLVGGRPGRGASPEERVARLAVAREIATVARKAS